MEPTTTRGRATRERIVATAGELFDRNGVHATGLDEVITAATVSKSQLYHYFQNKDALVRAVIDWQATRIIADTTSALSRVDSWEGLHGFFDDLYSFHHAHDCTIGCPLGTLAAELSQRDQPATTQLATSFNAWEARLQATFDRLRSLGLVRSDTDTLALASATLAAIEGGLLLAKASRAPEKLRAGLDAAISHIHSFAT